MWVPDPDIRRAVIRRLIGLRTTLSRGALGRVREERGVSLVETVMAMVLFAIIVVGLVGLLQSSIAANTLSREKTVAQQVGQEHVEWIRHLKYEDVGLQNGNPPGDVPATKPITVRGVNATITTQIQWVADPTPTSYATAANYKKVTVTVTNNPDGRVLMRNVTFVAPLRRAPYGGLNNAILNVTAKDLQSNELIGSAAVALSTGPSAPLNDATDPTTGLVTFAALTPNPTSGPQAYYDVAVTKAGYETYADYISPASPAAHIQLAPSQTVDTTILLYRPVTITVATQDAGGNPYTGNATVKVTSERSGTTQNYTATGGSTPAISTFAGRPTAPGNFTVRAFTAGPGWLCADPTTQLVWDDYPTTLASTIVLRLVTCPLGTLVVNVTQFGGPAANATVQVSGGRNEITPITGTTNAAGSVTFTIPSGSETYDITATDRAAIVSGSTTATISTGQTTTKTINLADPPVGAIQALVRWLNAPVNGATVRVQGGPYAIDRTLTTSSSGNVTFTNVPAGSGYIVTATKNGQSRVATGVAVTAGSTTPVTLNMPQGTINMTVRWASLPAASATVTITGGPNGGTYSGTTSAAGTVSIAVPATTSSYPYTVSAQKAGSDIVPATVTALADGGSANVTINLTPTKTITVTVRQGSTNIPNAPVSITGGPNGSAGVAPAYTGTTGATPAPGGTVAILVPAGTGTYTVKAYNCTLPSGNKRGSNTVTAAVGLGPTVTVSFSPPSNPNPCPGTFFP